MMRTVEIGRAIDLYMGELARLGRSAILIEIDAEYHAAAERRLAQQPLVLA